MVRLGDCTFAGTFVVPEGVQLIGSGADGTTLEAPEGEAVVVLVGSEGGTCVRDVTIVSDGPAAILARGGELACVEDVEVEATRGVGIAAEQVRRLEVRRTRVVGPVTPENADEQPIDPSPMDAATHGLTTTCVDEIVLEDVEVSGWASFGVLVEQGRLDWNRGVVHDTLGTGVMIARGEARLVDLEISGLLQGLRLVPSYGLVSSESRVESTRLHVHDNSNYGVIHHGGNSRHASLRLARNTGGLWAQFGATIAVEGPESIVEDNTFVGIVAANTSGIVIEDTVFARTAMATRLSGEVGAIQVGDGLQVVGEHGSVELRRVRFEDNERVGALIELNAPPERAFAFEDVVVSPPEQGIFVQGEIAPPAGWNAGVEPPGAARWLMPPDDPIYTIVGIIAPTDLPAYNPVCD